MSVEQVGTVPGLGARGKITARKQSMGRRKNGARR